MVETIILFFCLLLSIILVKQFDFHKLLIPSLTLLNLIIVMHWYIFTNCSNFFIALLVVFSLCFLVKIVLDHKKNKKSKQRNENSFPLVAAFFLITLIKLFPLFYLGSVTVIGPNNDGFVHSKLSAMLKRHYNYNAKYVEAQGLVSKGFHNLYSTNIDKKPLNYLNLYPNGFHLCIAVFSNLLNMKVLKSIQILTALITSLSIFNVYALLRELKYTKKNSFCSSILISLSAQTLFWYIFNEYPYSMFGAFFPIALFLLIKIVIKVRKIKNAFFLGFPLSGSLLIHSHFLILFFLYSFGFFSLLKKGNFLKRTKLLAISFAVLLLIAFPITRTIKRDFPYTVSKFKQEKAQQNPLSGVKWGDPLSMNMPAIKVSTQYFLFNKRFVLKASRAMIIILLLLSLARFKENRSPKYSLVLYGGLLYFANLFLQNYSLYNRIPLLIQTFYLPLLLETTVPKLKNRALNFLTKSFLIIFLWLFSFSWLITWRFFSCEKLTLVNSSIYEAASKQLDQEKNKIIFVTKGNNKWPVYFFKEARVKRTNGIGLKYEKINNSLKKATHLVTYQKPPLSFCYFQDIKGGFKIYKKCR